MIGFNKDACKWTLGVNGIEMSDLPEAPRTAADLPEVAKSSDRYIYNDTIRLVTHSNLHLFHFSLFLSSTTLIA